MKTISEFIAAAKKVGAYAASLDAYHDNDTSSQTHETRDSTHHLGDDTGKLVTEAYREHGAAVAASVIEAYLVTFNARRRRDGIRELTPQEAIAHLQQAIDQNGITATQQNEVRAEFSRLHAE